MKIDPLTLMLAAPFVIPIGLVIAASGYPWRRPKLQPYAWYALALLAPLAAIVALQAIFGLRAGSCVERPLNFVPLALAAASVAVGLALSFHARGFRRFVAGAALAICPATIFWSAVALMSLAGCWI